MRPSARLVIQVSAPILLLPVLLVGLQSSSPPTHPHNAVLFLSSSPAPAHQPKALLLLPALLASSSALPLPLKAVLVLPALLSSPTQAASLRPGFNMEYFKRYAIIDICFAES